QTCAPLHCHTCSSSRLHCYARLTMFFSFTPPTTPESYTLSLHDALPILARRGAGLFVRQHFAQPRGVVVDAGEHDGVDPGVAERDRKSTRLNSSHGSISYAVFCLKKKKIEDWKLGDSNADNR